MAKERKIVKSIRFTLNLLDELEWLCSIDNPRRKFANLSEACNKLSSIAMFLINQDGKIETGEFIDQMNGVIKEEKMMEWLQNLSEMQRVGLKQMIEMLDPDRDRHLGADDHAPV